MAKKNTIGGPRSRQTTAEDIKRRKQYKSRAEQDKMWQRRILIVTGVLIIFSLIILAGAIINERVIQPRQAISTVNDIEISTGDFQDRVRLSRWLTANQLREIYNLTGGNTQYINENFGSMINNLRLPSLIGGQVLDEMEEEIILKQAAEERGIEIDDAAVEKQVNNFMAQRVGLISPDQETSTPTLEPTITLTPLVSSTPSNTPLPTVTPTLSPTPEDATPGPALTPVDTPTPIPSLTPTATLEPDMIYATLEKEADRFYDTSTDKIDISRETVRQIFYFQAVRQAMSDHIGQDVAPSELQVNARHILISFTPDAPPGEAPPPTDEEKEAAKIRAEEIMQALQDGESFAELAKTSSNDPGSGRNGGELGWASPDNYVVNFKDAVLEAEIGEIAGPIETEFGYHIIQVHAREVRDLSPDELIERHQQAYDDWLADAKQEATITRRDDWFSRIPKDPTYNSLLGDIFPQ